MGIESFGNLSCNKSVLRTDCGKKRLIINQLVLWPIIIIMIISTHLVTRDPSLPGTGKDINKIHRP